MQPNLTETEAFVREIFEGQVDSGNVPMAEHMARVVLYLEGQDETTLQAAWLHDVVEDTKVTLEDLRVRGYTQPVIEAVKLLTHEKKVISYREYIDRICQSGNRSAIYVKIADQNDNLNPQRWLQLNRYAQNALRKKYKGVQEKLMEAAITL